MSSINEGGPVFPCLERGGNGLDLTHAGMTLRDYFAAKAMSGLITTRHPDHHGQDGAEILADDAYSIADAMLSAREEGGS